MKKSIFLILIGLMLVCWGCGDSMDCDSCYQSVRDAYPKALILTEKKSGSNMNFIVVDTVSKPNVYLYVVTGSLFAPNITRVQKLYPQND